MHSIPKTKIQEEEPKILIYRDFKKFTYTNFQSELKSKLNSRNSYQYYTPEKSFAEVLDNHAPKKIKFFGVIKKLHVN